MLLASIRRHSENYSAIREACFALRALLESKSTAGTTDEDFEVMARAMRCHGVMDLVEPALARIPKREMDPDSVEDTLVVYSAVAGIHATVDLAAAGPTPIRRCAIKAMFELGRRRPWLLGRCASEVAAAATLWAAEVPENDAVQRNAALLLGLCSLHTC